MIRVDVIGAPGVGKSYVINRLLNCNEYSSLFISKNEAMMYLSRYQKNNLSFKGRIICSLLKIHMSSLLYKILVDENFEIIDNNNFDEYFSSKSVIDAKLIQIERDELSTSKKIKRINNYIHTFKESVLIKNFELSGKVVLMDESLSHHLPHDLEKKYYQSFYKYLAPDLIIYCYTSPANLFNNLKTRLKETGTVVGNSNDLQEYTKKRLISYNTKKVFFEELGIPVIKINTGSEDDEIVDIAKKIYSKLNK